MSGCNGYDDIHSNVRYWINRIATSRGGDTLVIYDIGANDGELTLPLCSSGHRVVAFEPLPAARQRLKERALAMGVLSSGQENSTENSLQIIPCALGAAEARATMEVYSDDTFSSLHGRPREDLEQYDLTMLERVEVPVHTLDSVVSGTPPNGRADGRAASQPAAPLPPPDLVKIDVEGAEREVLQGAEKTLRQYRPAIVMEYSCINTRNAGYARTELLELLADLGYGEIYGLYRNEERALFTGAALESCRIWNVLALPLAYAAALEGVDIRTGLPLD